MSTAVTSSEGLHRQRKSGGHNLGASSITAAGAFRRSMCVHCKVARRVGTYCDEKCEVRASRTAGISTWASCD
eukprot:scaffold4321_cov33-Tisochrysis_lutea.AAC.5